MSNSQNTLVVLRFDKKRHLILISFYCNLPRGVYPWWGIVVSILVRTYVPTSARTSVRTYICPAKLDFKCYFRVLGIITSVVLDDCLIFLKRWFFRSDTPFFWRFFRYKRAYSGRAANQVIYAGKVLFADFEST